MARRFAVLVGNGHYPDEPGLQDLRCPGNDVERLREVLEDPERGGFDTVRVLADRPSYEVSRCIHQTLVEAGKDDLVVIYYSGHGKQNLAGRLHLMMADTVVKVMEATSVPVATLRDFIDVSSCNRVALVLDCCYAGAAGKAFAKGGVDEQLQLASRGRGTYVITASTGIQVALEKEGDECSVFTKHLVEGIRSGEADRDGDGLVSLDELYDYVHDGVLRESPQEPTKWGLDVRGDIIVARSGREPRKERLSAVRALLLELATQERITDRIAFDAIELARQPADTLDTRQQRRDQLLDLLRDKHINPAEFMSRWIRAMGGERGEDAPAAKPAQQAPGRKPATGDQPAPRPAPASAPAQADTAAAEPPPHIEIDVPAAADVAPASSATVTGGTGWGRTLGALVAITAGWAVGLAVAMESVRHELLFEDSYWRVDRYREENPYSYGPYDDETMVAFGLAGVAATLFALLLLRVGDIRLSWRRALSLLAAAALCWTLVGAGAGSEGGDEAVILPLVALGLFALATAGCSFRAWPGGAIGTAVVVAVVGFLAGAVGLGLVTDAFHLRYDAGGAGAVWGVFVGLGGFAPLLILRRRASS